MDIFKTFATDPKKELEGTWVPLDDEGAQIKVARANNRKHARLSQALYAANRTELRSPDPEVAADKDEELVVEATAQAILLDWKGIQYKGKDVPYSLEVSREMLKHSEFRILVLTHANNFELFRATEEEERGND